MKNDLRLFPETHKKLAYYVYLLIDNKGKIFYIGKGKGSRIYNHLVDAEFSKIKELKNSPKIIKIRDIQNKKHVVRLEILRHGMSEKEALEVESACIDMLRLTNLTNKIKGHYSNNRGRKNVREIKIMFEAREAKILDPTILININKIYYQEIENKELYEATRKAWKIDIKKANLAKYIFSTYLGIIRGVFEDCHWKIISSGKNKGRAYFIGKIANEETQKRFVDKSVRNYVRRGAQNPIRYVKFLNKRKKM
ncbi:MAG: hypothetical protein Q7K16_02390 [Candidatus Azambacteria bacterium]|nr:hypothetical protein [Candidatus Azambacteria bacterium]